jgi:hypothetical protein
MLPRFTEIVIWTLFYLGFAVFALTADAAAPMYRAIFIDRTASDWLPDASRSYEPSTPILGNKPSPYFGGGWWLPEDDARWGKGARNSIVVEPTRSLPAGTKISGRIGAMLGGLQGHVNIAIEINGTDCADVDFTAADGPKTFEISLPAPVTSGQALKITFVVSDANSPFLIHTGSDARQLGTRFYELTVAAPS